MKTILALDLGTTTGWAVQDRTSLITSGSISFKPQRFEGGGMIYLRFRQWLTELKNSCNGDDNEADSLALLDLVLIKHKEEE